MNTVLFDIVRKTTFDSGFAESTVNILVDDKPLADWMKAYELPMALEEGHPRIAGAYDAISTGTSVLEPYYLGREQADWGENRNKTLLLGCTCGVAACWPLLCKISVRDDTVAWSEFEQPHRDEEWHYSNFAGFVFDRRQYLDAIETMKNA